MKQVDCARRGGMPNLRRHALDAKYRKENDGREY